MVECPAGTSAGFFMRFTIRDMLWLTVVVGMGCGWLIEHRITSTRLRHAADFEEQLIICGTMLRETIECLEAEGYVWVNTPVRVHIERKQNARASKSN